MKRKKKYLFIFIGILLIISCLLFARGVVSTYYGLSISPNGKILVITSPSGVSMYRSSDGWKLHQQQGKPYGIQAYQGEFSYIAWSSDGKNLAVGELYNGVWVWDTETWKLLTERKGEESYPQNEPSFAWSPNGQQLALGIGNGEIWIWDKQQNKWELKDGPSDGLVSIAWTRAGKLLKLSDYEIHDIGTGALVSKLNHHIDGYGKISWSPDGSHVYVFFDLGGGVMDVKTNKYEFGSGTFPEFAWSYDGRYFASVTECSNEIQVWDTVNNVLIRQEKQGSAIYSLTWTSDGDLLALGAKGMETVVWNTKTGEILLHLFASPSVFCFFN